MHSVDLGMHRAKGVIKMELSEVQQYLIDNKDNADVSSYVSGLNPITTDRANEYLNTEDGKRLLQPKLDGNFNKGLETWKVNNLEKIYSERFNKENTTADPRDVELNKMKTMLEQMQKDGTRKDLTSKSQKIAIEKKLPLDLVDFFIGENEEVTVKNLDKLEAIFASHVETLVTERLKGGSYTPPKGSGNSGGKNPFSKETFNLTEQGKMFKENPELAKTLMAASNK